jgi:glycosyltransferase involved in cell wall biosynthesis
VKVLILSRYDDKGSSSRLRLFQYIPYLEKNGFEVAVSPLLDNSYLEIIYSGKRYSIFKIAARYIKRIRIILKSHKYDLLIIEKELFPFLPSWTEQILKLFHRPYIVDYDDATFHNYDKHPKRIVRWLLRKKISTIMRCSAAVIAGNRYIEDYAQRSGAAKVYLLPTVIDLKKYKTDKKEKKAEFIIGWIGSPSTTKYLKLVEHALIEASTRIPLKLVLIGSGLLQMGPVNILRKEWSENTEAEDIQLFDVGIMPLKDDYWEQGKCGYKIIQYMACGIPVIASPVGVNKEIISHDVDGYLAGDQADWINYIEILACQHEKCVKFGEMGRKKVESFYCTQVTAPKFLDILQDGLKMA